MRKEKHKVKSANTYNFGSRYQWKLWDIFIGLANFQYQRTEISQNLKAHYFILQIDKFWHQVNSQRFQDYYVRTMALIGKEETRTGVHMSRGIWRSQHTLYPQTQWAKTALSLISSKCSPACRGPRHHTRGSCHCLPHYRQPPNHSYVTAHF